jgi:hypothetical protein
MCVGGDTIKYTIMKKCLSNAVDTLVLRIFYIENLEC